MSLYNSGSYIKLEVIIYQSIKLLLLVISFAENH